MVERGARPDRGDRADADAEDDGDQRGGERQTRRRRQSLDDDLAHRPLLAERLAEISAREPREPRGVLHGQRPVERVLAAKPLERLGIRALSHRRTRGVAERGGVEREDENGDTEHHGDERDQARGDRAEQASARARPCGAGPGTRARWTARCARGL